MLFHALTFAGSRGSCLNTRPLGFLRDLASVKAAYSVTMNIFRKKNFLFKTFVKVELSYVFTIKMFSTAENCMEK